MLLFTDPDRTPRPWEIAARMPAGSGVVYRAFGRPDALETGLRLRTACREAGVALLVGMDVDLADRLEADGLHLPERALSAAYAQSGRRPDWLITGAVHSVEAAAGARDLDAAILSPIFPAGGASAEKAALGVERLVEAANRAETPVFALGGVTAGNCGELLGAGAAGLAAIGGIAEAFSA